MQQLIDWDVQAFLWINSHAGGWLDYLFGWTTYLGEAYFFLPIVLLFMLIWDDSEEIIPHFLEIVFYFTAACTLTSILKDLFHRPRPWKYFYDAIDQGKVLVNFLFQLNGSRSFPSGHTAAVFSLAYGLHAVYGKKMRIMYFAAIILGMTRVYTGAHFPLDVLGGAITGITGSFIARRVWNSKWIERLTSRIQTYVSARMKQGS